MTAVHFFLGIGQGKRAQSWLSEQLPEITFHQAPDYLRARSEEDMAAQAVDYIERSVGDEKDYWLMAESQAGPAVVEAVYRRNIATPRRLILIQPLGLNPSALGNSPAERMKTVLQRSRQFWRDPQQRIWLHGNRWTVEYLAWSSLRNVRRFKGRWTDGSNLDIREKLAAIAETVPVMVYASSDDAFFPYHEVIADFPHRGLLHEIPGGHLNRATEHGVEQLRLILHSNHK